MSQQADQARGEPFLGFSYPEGIAYESPGLLRLAGLPWVINQTVFTNPDGLASCAFLSTSFQKTSPPLSRQPTLGLGRFMSGQKSGSPHRFSLA